MTQLTQRQREIIEFVGFKGNIQNQDIVDLFTARGDTLSKKTVGRELSELLEFGYIKKTGKGRAVSYVRIEAHPLLKDIDHKEYFSKDPDTRAPETVHFQTDIFSKLQGLFSQRELSGLTKKSDEFKQRVRDLPPAILKKEFERITVELAWKSSKIEGNTYSLIDTEILIKELTEAVGHPRGEAIMILNHKKTLDYIAQNKERFKKISLRDIEDVHQLLIGDLDVKPGLRRKPVGITGTNYRPLEQEHQVREATEQMIVEINRATDPWSKALIALLLIAYIQPFEDGNKRTSRLVANACLMAEDICPLSFRSVDVATYKRAILFFYELGNASLMKDIFLEQFDFAVNNYFL